MENLRVLQGMQSENIDAQIPDTPSEYKYTTYKRSYAAVETLRSTGKDFMQFIAEHLENLIDANARHAKVLVSGSGQYIESVTIIDDGWGMDASALSDSFSLGDVKRTRKAGETGKFGIGGTLSSLVHFNRKETYTLCANGEVICRAYDMGKVKEHDEWHSFPIDMTEKEKESFEEELASIKFSTSGTVIKFSNPRGRLKLEHWISKAKKEMGKRYYDQINRGHLHVYLNGEKVSARCPAMSDEVDARKKEFSFKPRKGKTEPTIKITTIDLSELNVKSIVKDESLMSTAGIFFRRNGVLVNSKPVWFGDFGISSKMTSKRQNDSRGRVIIDFGDEADTLFNMPNSKDSVQCEGDVGDALADKLLSFFVSVRDKAAQGGTARSHKVRESVSKKVLMQANNNILPTGIKKGSESFLEQVKYQAAGSTPQFAFIEGGTLVVNTSHHFYQQYLSNSELKTLTSSLTFVMCLLMAERECRHSLESSYEGKTKESIAAQRAVDDLIARLDLNLRNVDH